MQAYKFIRVGELITYHQKRDGVLILVGMGKYLGPFLDPVSGWNLSFEGGHMKILTMIPYAECFSPSGELLADDGWHNVQEAIKLYVERTGRIVQITE